MNKKQIHLLSGQRFMETMCCSELVSENKHRCVVDVGVVVIARDATIQIDT